MRLFIDKTHSCMNPTKKYWDDLKSSLDLIEVYSYEETRSLLIKDGLYERYIGKAKNRTFIKENAKLYKSVIEHTSELEEVFKNQNTYNSSYNLSKRLKFIVDLDRDLSKLKCECGRVYTWTRYCRYCPNPKKTKQGLKHTEETKKKMRLSTLEYLASCKGQVVPRYNKNSIPLIEQYGLDNGYKFMHAENGGEFFVKELGYFLDAYDPISNVALEVDESYHFNIDGSLKEKDIERQKQIESLLGCKFIRIKFNS